MLPSQWGRSDPTEASSISAIRVSLLRRYYELRNLRALDDHATSSKMKGASISSGATLISRLARGGDGAEGDGRVRGALSAARRGSFVYVKCCCRGLVAITYSYLKRPLEVPLYRKGKKYGP